VNIGKIDQNSGFSPIAKAAASRKLRLPNPESHRRKMQYQEVAEAILGEVGLRLSDVVRLPRRGRRLQRYRGETYYCHPTREHIIRATLPVDSVWMLHILAHEVGHFHYRHLLSSVRPYVAEYEAEMYAFSAFERAGVEIPDFHVLSAKKYVRTHCYWREAIVGDVLIGDPYAWNAQVIEWCGFIPKFGGKFV
jgi:hypothetical protein